MNLENVLNRENIILHLSGKNQTDVIDELITRLYKNKIIENKAEFKACILKREEELSTAIGDGVAIPHAQSKTVLKPAIIMGRSLEGIMYGGEKTNLIFMIAAPNNTSNEHLKLLSKLSTFLLDERFRAKLIVARSNEEVIQAINEQEQLETKQEQNSETDTGKFLIGITGCMTGIAHTYMAAEALKTVAHKRGMKVKIQTNGANGPENRLTREDVIKADAIIIAHDIDIDTSIFGTKQYVDVPVKRAISNAETLLDQALSYNVKEIELSIEENKNERKDTHKNGLNFYKHVMSGVSYMIPFVVVGGIFIAISFMFGIYASDPTSSQYNVMADFFNQVGGKAAFALMVPVMAGYIGYSIAGKQGLAPAMIGGMMASLGGSGFLGGLVAGFIGGFSAKVIAHYLRKISKSFQGLISVLVIPLISTLIVGIVMFFVLNTPMSALNEFLENWLQGLSGVNAWLLGGLLAAMMASDMGGPINKTASAFGLAMFAANIFEPSAALMVGGMVPPIGIALATTIFKNRFTEQEREAGKACYVLGASFITEGAIPFAASDPLRIIPANIIGAAIGGALSMALNISLKAPHGGIFVIPIACNKPIIYILCILLGSFITCFIVGCLKKPLTDEEQQITKDSMSLI